MARAKKSAPEQEGSWLDTYADMVTLLLCFFVLLFSQSTIETEKWEKLLKAFQNPTDEPQQVVISPNQDEEYIGTNTNDEQENLEVDFSNLAQMIQEAIDASGSGVADNVEVSAGEGVVFLRFNNTLLFNPDSAILRREALSFIDTLGDIFLELNEEIVMIRVNGHTAKINSTGSSLVNDRVLSSDRANSVIMYLEDVKKIDAKKLISMGFGGNYPLADNSTEEGRAKNRRVEILVLGSTSTGVADDYWKSIFSGDMSLDDYQEVYQALAGINSGASSGSENGGSSDDGLDAIDRIQLDD